jgi:prevent-host-death family protein
VKVNIHAAKTNLSQLIERAQAGEEVIIARGDTPVAKLVPLAPAAPKRQPNTLRGLVVVEPAFFEPLPESELSAWEGES